MPIHSDVVRVAVKNESVWEFVTNTNNWASLFPGYQRHLEVAPDQFRWQVRGEAGVWSRVVKFDVTVQAWDAPKEVVFAIQGETEPVEGTGRFFLESESESTVMGFELDLSGRGPTAPMLDMLIGKFMSEYAPPFLAALGSEIEKSAAATQAQGGKAQKVSPPGKAGVVFVEYSALQKLSTEAFAVSKIRALRRVDGVTLIRRVEQHDLASGESRYCLIISCKNLAQVLNEANIDGLANCEGAHHYGITRMSYSWARSVDSYRPSIGARGLQFARKALRLARD